MRLSLAVPAVLALSLPLAAQTNVLLIVADDMGVDRVAAYGEHPDPGNTPVLDQLAADGMLFRNAYASPVCTASRAQILTGRYGFRTGVGGGPPTYLDPPWLKNHEVTIAEALSGSHETMAVGKWHLDNDAEPFINPLDQGFDTHRGTTGNINQFLGKSYFDWTKTIDGVWSNQTTYATTDSVDDALALINGASGPWFCYMAMNAPHGPLHKPPQSLHSYNLPANIGANIPVHVQAMIEAMDTEVGRLFASMDAGELANTVVIFIGDNGTTQAATTLPFIASHAKGTVYEGGINVPMIIKGPGVQANSECQALVSVTDLFATICDIAGVSQTSATDSVSMMPYFSNPALPSLRDMVYNEYYAPDTLELKTFWDVTMRDERYKVIQRRQQNLAPFNPIGVEFYDLLLDPFETSDLRALGMNPTEQAAYNALNDAIAELHGPWLNFGEGLAGASGEPVLAASGLFESNETFTISLSNGPASANSGLFFGLSTLDFPFKGGILVPDYTAAGGALFLLTTDPLGEVELMAGIPAGTPGGIHVWFQYWIQDATGPVGWTASNAIAGTTQD